MINRVLIFTLPFTLIIWSEVFSQSVLPQVVEPGTISTASVEFGTTFSRDMRELYFTRCSGQWGKGELHCSIHVSTRKNNAWTEPEVAPFSGKYNDSDPYLARDGMTLFFISTRSSGTRVESADIWRISRIPGGAWGDAEKLPGTINSPGREYSPRTTGNGDLYFASDRDGGHGQGDLYLAVKQDDGYRAPVNLGPTINSPQGEWNLAINKDGSILIFEGSQREENVSSYGDLYISFRSDNNWTRPQNITELNTSGSDLYPELINKDQTLVYSSSRAMGNPWVNIYQVNFLPLLEKYRKRSRSD